VGVTSIQAEAGNPVDMADVKAAVQVHLEEVFQIGLQPSARQALFRLADLSSTGADVSALGATAPWPPQPSARAGGCEG
jgi:hypothetical protein